METELELSFTLTAKEYRQLSYRLILRNKLIRNLLIFILILLILAVLINSFLQLMGGQPNWQFLGIIVLLLGLFVLTLRFIVGKRYQSDTNFQHEISYAFKQDGVHVTTKTATAHLKWETFDKMLVDKEWIFLYHGSGKANPIPGRVVDQATESALVQTMKNNGIKVDR